MLVPIAWLRDYIDLAVSTDEIAATLASLGFPVAAIDRRPTITGVVVGKIARMEKHPNADRLQVCTIDVAGPRALTIATAATNVAQDQIVPVATIGARLPELTIAPRKMRGIDSEGMLCSAGELGLTEEWFEDGIMQLDESVPLGADVVSLFRLLDDVLDVEVTPNRPDALSIVGIARELAAAYGLKLRAPSTDVTFTNDAAIIPRSVPVRLESPDARRFVAQRVSNLRVRTAPAWIRVRLALAGQRPIDNLVDISNFVMLELGEPLYFYDLDKVPASGIIVRDARAGEAIVTLDGEERTLDAMSLVIADESQATGLAGLKGGRVNEISDTTSDVLIEAATFHGPRIRRMSIALGLRTEASGRHEKGLPYGIADVAAARAAHLLAAEGGGVHPAEIVGVQNEAPASVALPPREVARLLGYDAAPDEIAVTLERLGFRVHRSSADGAVVALDVTVPYWRTDIAIAADLVEEFGRVAGYDRLVTSIPPVFDQAISSDVYTRERDLAQLLAALGYTEAISLALEPVGVGERLSRAGIEIPKPLEIRNPLSEDQRYMRFSLLPNLIGLAARYRARFTATDTGARGTPTYFEIGHVFFDHDGPRERADVAFLRTAASAPVPAWRDDVFLGAKSDVTAVVRALCGREPEFEASAAPLFHRGKTARIVVDSIVVGYVGVVDPRAPAALKTDDHVVAALLFTDELPAHREATYRTPSRYPAVYRDLAIVLDERSRARDIERAVRDASPEVASVTIFDEYRGPQIGANQKSIALRLALQRADATMTDVQAESTIVTILAALREKVGAALRT